MELINYIGKQFSLVKNELDINLQEEIIEDRKYFYNKSQGIQFIINDKGITTYIKLFNSDIEGYSKF